VVRTGRRLVGLLAAVSVSGAVMLGSSLSASAASTPSGERAYELVSPPDKHGADVVADGRRTRVAADGSAVGFISLGAFGDAVGTGVVTEYLSVRLTDPAPRSNGWTTHAITPRQEAGSLVGILTALEPMYVGEFSPDLQRGVFFTRSSVTDDPFVSRALNLYRRTDLRSPGTGLYELVTECPLCELTAMPLPPLPGDNAAFRLRPELAGSSPDLGRIIFESQQRLTGDTPSVGGQARLYEWSDGEVRLVGRVPRSSVIECDDAGGPDPCSPYPVSVGGQGGTIDVLTPHTVSDGSDGHRRIFFTTPTDSAGTTPAPDGIEGNVFMRVDESVSVRLNASERTVPDAYSRAKYWDATPDGTRVLISTAQALTDDAPADGQNKLYMYDASKASSEPNNLTFLSADGEGNDQGVALGPIGMSADAQSVYFVAAGQLVAGEPELVGNHGIYLWHSGSLEFIGRINDFGASIESTSHELLTTGANMNINPRQARVSQDGRRLLFSALDGSGLLGYDHGRCVSALGVGCRELYVYSADSGALACVSCNPSGAPATAMATTFVREFFSGANPTKHTSRALTDDGSRVFFSSGDALVADDTNGRIDAYEYNIDAGTVRLVSSGKSASDTWFMDASSDGRDVFFLTRERLVGWDRDDQYDIYDARTGGGFPEPPPVPPVCLGAACQGVTPVAPVRTPPGTGTFNGAGNVVPRRASRSGRARACRRGFVKKRVRGKRRCVKRRAGGSRQGGRRGNGARRGL
jgi:hypothetical protein